MAITNSLAIAFSNNRVRPSADQLARAYYRAAALVNRWASLGSGQAALDQMQGDFRSAANQFVSAYAAAYWTEKVWFNGLSASFPNDATPVWDNGSGTATDPGRPALTGAAVNNLISRCQQFQNWLLSATGSFTDAARGGVAWLNTVLQVSADGPTPIALVDAGNFVNRCNELVSNYQAAANANLNTVLAAAVNPNPQ